jgi:formylglycine-generating enzyme
MVTACSPVTEKAKMLLLMVTAPDFVFIRGGEFTMGSPETEVGTSSDETQHQVKLSDFYMSKYELTVAEFRKFVEATNYKTDAEKGGDPVNWRYGASDRVSPKSEENHPVVNVSWNDAVEYCRWLSEKTGKLYRLPTEAEWEYACRAGSRTAFNTGGNITTSQSNYDGNNPYNNNQKGRFRANTVAVDTFEPNAWGLFNMHGNVLEWCSDWGGDWRYRTYYNDCKAKGTVHDPQGVATGWYRVVRGGGWWTDAESCRSAYRHDYGPEVRYGDIGFRLVLMP